MAGKFTKNVSITFVTFWINFILALGASVIIARKLGPEGKGIYAIAALLPGILLIIFDINIGPATIFNIGKKKCTPKQGLGLDIIFSGALSVICILVGLAVIFFGADKFFPGIAKQYLIMALSIIPLRFFSGFVTDILLVMRKIKRYNLVGIIQHFIWLFSLVILFFMSKVSVSGVILTEVFSFLLASIVLFYWAIKATGGITFNVDKKIFKNFISFGFAMYLISIAWFLHLKIDMFLVNKFLLATAAGLYSVSVALAEKVWVISKSVGTILFPKISRSDKEQSRMFVPLVCRNVMFLTFFITVFLFFVGPKAITILYSGKFIGSILPFQILLLGTITLTGDKMISSYFSGQGILKPKIITNFISLILNVILNLFLIPRFGIKGAAISTAITYNLLFLMDLMIFTKISNNKILDVVLIKKSDFRYYKNAFDKVRLRIKNRNNN